MSEIGYGLLLPFTERLENAFEMYGGRVESDGLVLLRFFKAKICHLLFRRIPDDLTAENILVWQQSQIYKAQMQRFRAVTLELTGKEMAPRFIVV